MLSELSFFLTLVQLLSWQMAVVIICNFVFSVEAVAMASGSFWNCHALSFLKYNNPLFFPV